MARQPMMRNKHEPIFSSKVERTALANPLGVPMSLVSPFLLPPHSPSARHSPSPSPFPLSPSFLTPLRPLFCICMLCRRCRSYSRPLRFAHLDRRRGVLLDGGRRRRISKRGCRRVVPGFPRSRHDGHEFVEEYVHCWHLPRGTEGGNKHPTTFSRYDIIIFLSWCVCSGLLCRLVHI